jgi:hypothetical protein
MTRTAVLLLLAIALGFAACGGGSKEPMHPDNDTDLPAAADGGGAG